MLNFVYNTPTKIYFGRNSEQELAKLVKEQNCKKVLIHYGGSSAKRTGLLNKIYNILNYEGIDFVSLGGVVPNPRLSKVYEGIKLCKSEQVDFILAVGGGSVIDSAKAIGYGLGENVEDVWDFYCNKSTPSSCLAIGAVLTISAAGSEMSNSCVITNDSSMEKRGCKSEYGRLKFAVLNPDLTMTLPMYQTQSGCVDILMHTMERYFNHSENMELTDGFSEALMRTVIHNAKILMNDPNNYNARGEIMWASSLSHNGLTGCGTDGGDWACHQMEHELGGMFDVTHGAGLSAVWGSWARYVYSERKDRFCRFAELVMGVSGLVDEDDIILEGIHKLEEFFKFIEMPVSIKELGIELTKEQVAALAYNCSYKGTRTIGVVKKLTQDDMYEIFMAAR